jgi:hypothetical protein
MMRVVLWVGVFALVCIASVAEARRHHRRDRVVPICDNINIFNPCPGYMIPGAFDLPKIKGKSPEIVQNARKTRRHRRRVTARTVPAVVAHVDRGASWASVMRPLRHIAGRLTCALNVNAALAERGIKGTGSALAHSFDSWGIRVPGPVVGAVAVTDRRGGGHVAIVARVEGGRVWVFNPGRRGWSEREYTSRHARYRVAG